MAAAVRQNGDAVKTSPTPVVSADAAAHYDDVPYPKGAYAQTHPDYMAALATLLGMQPPAVEHCRVLEIGCAGGANLLPMAWGLPGSRFVGVDISGRQIETARANAAALGVDNLEYVQADILDLAASLGDFDYIIAHGVYSWVPPEVRDALLAVCKRHLSQQGVAYISYNVYPGWHALGAIREMILYHTRHAPAASERVAQARELLRFLDKAGQPVNGTTTYVREAYRSFLRYELERIEGRDDSAFLHDELEIVNDPVYFHEFVAHAARHGLQFLTEARFAHSQAERITAEAEADLEAMSADTVEQEQYLDFVHNATFRRTLLCHADVTLSRTVAPDVLRNFFFASAAHPVPQAPNADADGRSRFQGSDESVLTTNHPASKAVMMDLIDQWPRAVPYDDLVARAIPGGGSKEDVRQLQATLAHALTYSERLMRIHTVAPPVARRAVERPCISRLSLFEAEQDDVLTNVYHQTAHLDRLARFMLPLLDGTRTRDEVARTLLDGPVAEGTLEVVRDGGPIDDATERDAFFRGAVAQRINWLADNALLVDPASAGVTPNG